MRRLATLLAAPILLTAPVAAQDFTGKIVMKISGGEMKESMDMTLYLAESKQAIVMLAPADAGPMAGQEIRMVIDPAAGKLTTLMPMPPGMGGMPGAKGMKMVTDFSQATQKAEQAAGESSARELGTSQTIAGMKCDDWEVTTKEETVNMCLTTELGPYRIPEMGQMGRPPEMPAWTKAFGNKPVFPLRVWGGKDNVEMIVTGVERGSVPARILDANPEGYMAMPGMGG